MERDDLRSLFESLKRVLGNERMSSKENCGGSAGDTKKLVLQMDEAIYAGTKLIDVFSKVKEQHTDTASSACFSKLCDVLMLLNLLKGQYLIDIMDIAMKDDDFMAKLNSNMKAVEAIINEEDK